MKVVVLAERERSTKREAGQPTDPTRIIEVGGPRHLATDTSIPNPFFREIHKIRDR